MGVEGELFFLPRQADRVMSLDESEASLDGTSKNGSGRPGTQYCSTNANIPRPATSTNKSGVSSTVICGSTAAFEPLPPHLQNKSDALEENKRIDTNIITDAKYTIGTYGFKERTTRPMTVNCNVKGGMDYVEFEKYLKESICLLYPDAADVPGLRVLIIVDSCPGRVNELMLAWLRARGFYLLPGVPNTTHVTQVTDQNYGSFKTHYWQNLTKLTEYRQGLLPPKSLGMFDLPLLIFGGLVDKQDI